MISSTVDAMPRPLTPFHLAIPVHDLAAARAFYGVLLGCAEGRSAGRWVDFEFFGHQLVCHVADDMRPAPVHNPVDGHDVPVPHFGVVLQLPDWHALAKNRGCKEQGSECTFSIRRLGSRAAWATCRI